MATAIVGRNGRMTLPQALRGAYSLDGGTRLELVPLDATPLAVCARLAPLDNYADEGPVPDLDAARGVRGAARRGRAAVTAPTDPGYLDANLFVQAATRAVGRSSPHWPTGRRPAGSAPWWSTR